MRRSSFLLAAAFLSLCLFVQTGTAAEEAGRKPDQSKLDRSFMAQALDLARMSVRRGNHPFGAILVKDGRIIVRAENTAITDKRPSHHAEINAIDKAIGGLGLRSLKGCTLYASSEPCPMCAGAIFIADVSVVVYGATQKFLDSMAPNYEEIGLTEMLGLPDQHVEVRGPVLQEEAEKILADYLEAHRRPRK